MSATVAEPVIVVRKIDRERMAYGNTVSYEVDVDGRWVGWVGDHRGVGDGLRRPGRRWFACHREHDDEHARWSDYTFRTRQAAVAALVARVRDA